MKSIINALFVALVAVLSACSSAQQEPARSPMEGLMMGTPGAAMPLAPRGRLDESVIVLNQTIENCPISKLRVLINASETEYFSFQIQGKPARIIDGNGHPTRAPLLPPQSRGYLCQNNLGTFNLTAQVWIVDVNVFEKTSRIFTFTQDYSRMRRESEIKFDGVGVAVL